LLRLDFSTAKGCQRILVPAEPYCPRAASTGVITVRMARHLDANFRVEVDEGLSEVLPLAA
jgi:hypothetical protein